MKYSINLRMKNLGPAKYLIDSCEAGDFSTALNKASDLMDKVDIEKDYFVEIVDNATGDRVAGLNLGGTGHA
jgi:hypothetical protein